MIPKFSSEEKEAAWWDADRSDLEAETRRRMALARAASETKHPAVIARIRRSGEDELEELAHRIADEISDHANGMTQERRAKADAETRKIAARIRHRAP